MVTTLIKHEALRTRGWLAILFGAATLMTLVGTLMSYTPWALIQGLGLFLSFVAVGGFLLIVQVGLAYDYWRSSYSRTGYFTQSLPVRGSTIYAAKLFWGSLITVAALIWNLVLLVPTLSAVWHVAGAEVTFRSMLDELGVMLAAAPAWFWALAVFFVVAMFVGFLAQFYFAASIGSEARMNRLGIVGPILVFFGLYVVMQVLLFAGIAMVPLGVGQTANGDVGFVPTNFLDLMLNNQDAELMPVGFIPVLIVVSAVLIWRTVVSWNKKVSLA